MSKLSAKDIGKLKRDADAALKGDAFMYRRHLQPGIVSQLAKYAGDAALQEICDRAAGRKSSSPEWADFINACHPARVSALCVTAQAKLAAAQAELQAEAA